MTQAQAVSAIQISDKVARLIFQNRGNPEEVRLVEVELSTIIQSAISLALSESRSEDQTLALDLQDYHGLLFRAPQGWTAEGHLRLEALRGDHPTTYFWVKKKVNEQRWMNKVSYDVTQDSPAGAKEVGQILSADMAWRVVVNGGQELDRFYTLLGALQVIVHHALHTSS